MIAYKRRQTYLIELERGKRSRYHRTEFLQNSVRKYGNSSSSARQWCQFHGLSCSIWSIRGPFWFRYTETQLRKLYCICWLFRVMKNYVPHSLETMYRILSKPGTPYSRNHAPCAPSSKPGTLYPRNHAFQPEIWPKNGITHQCLKIKIKPLTFQHKNHVNCFHFQYPGWDMLTWYSNVKKISEILNDKSGENYLINCAWNWLLKGKTQWFHSLFLSGFVILKTQDFSLIFKHYWRYSTFLSNFWWKYIVFKVLST